MYEVITCVISNSASGEGQVFLLLQGPSPTPQR